MNEVSYPTKFGEYVSSQTGVVTTDIGWDVADMVKRTGCGLLVDWQSPPDVVAKQVVDELNSDDGEAVRTGCDLAAAELDRDHWIPTVGSQLRDLLA